MSTNPTVASCANEPTRSSKFRQAKTFLTTHEANMKKRLLLILALSILASLPSKAKNWMNHLPDNALICMLSIPGTHDSGTGNGFEPEVATYGERFARTQDLDIARQWKAGIRAFDLRPCSHGEYLNINHSIISTNVRFDDVLFMLRDLLVANPSEFAIILMNHESDGDVDKNYNELVVRLLRDNRIKNYLADFNSTLTVKDVRGKILILSRDRYADEPIAGGFFSGWTGSDNWERQTSCHIKGKLGTDASCYVQDYWSTHEPGAQQIKLDIIRRMLDFSTGHESTSQANAIWYFNMASAYALADTLFGKPFALSDGYRLNATHTNAAIVEYLDSHKAGPTGIVMADYAGVDKSNGYKVRGKKLVRTIINNNFRYLPKKQ